MIWYNSTSPIVVEQLSSNTFNEHYIYLVLLPVFLSGYPIEKKLENVFVKHYAPNHMPDPKGEWS